MHLICEDYCCKCQSTTVASNVSLVTHATNMFSLTCSHAQSQRARVKEVQLCKCGAKAEEWVCGFRSMMFESLNKLT